MLPIILDSGAFVEYYLLSLPARACAPVPKSKTWFATDDLRSFQSPFEPGLEASPCNRPDTRNLDSRPAAIHHDCSIKVGNRLFGPGSIGHWVEKVAFARS